MLYLSWRRAAQKGHMGRMLPTPELEDVLDYVFLNKHNSDKTKRTERFDTKFRERRVSSQVGQAMPRERSRKKTLLLLRCPCKLPIPFGGCGRHQDRRENALLTR